MTTHGGPPQALVPPSPPGVSRTRRVGGAVILIAYVAFFAWLDWITHRSIVFIVIVGGGIVALYLLRDRIGRALESTAAGESGSWLRPLLDAWQAVPDPVRRLLVALVPLFYFILRGQGTSGAGSAVLFAALLVVVPVVFLGGPIDNALSGFYAVRNKVLPRWLRWILAPALGVVIAFGIVHGTLRDLPAFFGGSTTVPQSPVDMSGRFFIATLLAGAFTVLLLREGSRRA